MNECIAGLSPTQVFGHFRDILLTPHRSGHEEGMAELLLGFARAHGLPARRDQVGNVIIERPASAGREGHGTVILQAHMDMVAVRGEGVAHDFDRDPIEAVVEGGMVMAKGTTLGADNGIGVALAMALLGDPGLSCPPLRAILTVEEETTMRGACGLDPTLLEGQGLINLDSEEDGCIYVACAGSLAAEIRYAGQAQPTTGLAALTVTLRGLLGGHSGADIHLRRGNAILDLLSLLWQLPGEIPWRLAALSGGQAQNAIPAAATATLALDPADLPRAKEALRQGFLGLRATYGAAEPGLEIDFGEGTAPSALGEDETREFLGLAAALPNGALRQSGVDPSVVETSLSCGLATGGGGDFTLCTYLRSLKEEALDALAQRLLAIAAPCARARLTLSGRHPCWDGSADTPLARTLAACYQEASGTAPRITAMHAGLECAEFTRLSPGLAIASIGPTLLSPHSPAERLRIAGVGTLYEALRLTLAQL
ncbi:MAG: beta-Ala-His dipeptidase [Succinivibrionaceae bacterium]|nr:beta-Ala-His dipeptidase [Succinivibrionaceae bacterium]